MMSWTDEQLVSACLEGNELAWSTLIDKYKNLIFSIPIRYGLSRDDASEVFQQVCLRLLSELPGVRDPNCLASWLIKVTLHTSFHWLKRERLHKKADTRVQETKQPDPSQTPDDSMLQLERERILREAMLQIKPRCRELIHMLFFQTPALPYDEVAKNLGLARGSIGFIRMRCLKQLRDRLNERGFR